MNPFEVLFIKRLNQIAEAAEYELTEHEIANYDRCLAPIGYENLIPVLDEILSTQERARPMPSIPFILESLSKQNSLSDKNLAQAAVDKLWSRISLRGYTWPTQFENSEEFKRAFKAECGELAWEVVQTQGGWVAFCNSTNEAYKQKEFIRTQLRDVALSIIERSKLGIYDKPPELPQTPTKHLKLVSDLAKQFSMEGKSLGPSFEK